MTAGGGAHPEATERVPRDSVDALLASWGRQRRDLDLAPVGVVARMARVRRHLEAEMERVFAADGLDAATFAVLVTLARIGEPDGLPRRRLGDELGATAAAIAARTDALVDRGLVERRPEQQGSGDPVVGLSPEGREMVDRIVPAHLANERRLLAGLDDAEVDALTDLLRKLLVEFEGTRPPDGADARVGMTLAPAHLTAELRETVGLPPATGLLVRRVEPGAPAASVLRAGDVLLRSGTRELRSVTALYAALADAAASGTLPLVVLRGPDERDLALPLPAKVVDGALAASPGRAAFAEHVV